MANGCSSPIPMASCRTHKPRLPIWPQQPLHCPLCCAMYRNERHQPEQNEGDLGGEPSAAFFKSHLFKTTPLWPNWCVMLQDTLSMYPQWTSQILITRHPPLLCLNSPGTVHSWISWNIHRGLSENRLSSNLMIDHHVYWNGHIAGPCPIVGQTHMLSVPYPCGGRWGGLDQKKIKDLNLVNQSPRVLEIKLRSQLHLTTPTSAKIESRIVKNNINRSPRLPPNLPCSRLPLLPIHHLIAQFLFCNDCVAIPIKN